MPELRNRPRKFSVYLSSAHGHLLDELLKEKNVSNGSGYVSKVIQESLEARARELGWTVEIVPAQIIITKG